MLNYIEQRYCFTLKQYPPTISLMKLLVEVGGIEPPSLSNRVKVATCLAPHFKLTFATPAGQDLQIAAFYCLVPNSKTNLSEPACFPALV